MPKEQAKDDFSAASVSDEMLATLKEAREAAGLTQKQLAERTNGAVSKFAIRKLDSKSQKYTPSIDVVVHMAEALGYELKLEKK